MDRALSRDGDDSPVPAAEMRVPSSRGQRRFVRGCLELAIDVMNVEGSPRPRDFLFNTDPHVDLACFGDPASLDAAVLIRFNGPHLRAAGGCSVGYALFVPLLTVGGFTYCVVVNVLRSACTTQSHCHNKGKDEDVANSVPLGPDEASSAFSATPALSRETRVSGLSPGIHAHACIGGTPVASHTESFETPTDSRNFVHVSETSHTLDSSHSHSCCGARAHSEPDAHLENFHHEFGGSHSPIFRDAEIGSSLNIRSSWTFSRGFINHAAGECLLVNENDRGMVFMHYGTLASGDTGRQQCMRLVCERNAFARGNLIDSVLFAEFEEWNNSHPPENEPYSSDRSDFSQFSKFFESLKYDGRHTLASYSRTSPVGSSPSRKAVWNTEITQSTIELLRCDELDSLRKLRNFLLESGFQQRSSELKITRPLLNVSGFLTMENIEVNGSGETDGGTCNVSKRRRRSQTYIRKCLSDMTKDERRRWESLLRARRSIAKRDAHSREVMHELQEAKEQERRARQTLAMLLAERKSLRDLVSLQA